MLSIAAFPVSADQYTDQIGSDQQQLQQNQAEIAALQHDIAARQQKEAQLTAALSQLTTQIAAAQARLAQNRATLFEIQSRLAATERQLAAARAQLAADKVQLAAQLVTIYELQKESTPLNNLLSSGSFNQFWTGLIDMQRISSQEDSEVDEIDSVQDAIEADYAAIAAQERTQQQVLDAMQAAEQALSAERAQQESDLSFQRALQAQDLRDEQQTEAANAQLNSQIAYLQSEERAALAAGGGSGVFAWPDSGPITQGFGCTPYTFEEYDPDCPTKHFHPGIDIAGPCGADITAADAGIAYIEPFQAYGYGNYIIIVHGNGWETLYGHMSGFAVRSGVTVSRGGLIGYEGSTGNSTGCHLHFGVNHNGVWVNPLLYLS
jgi:murein DD-endopeptidase MepM/ murein hydrolase activator NlpD